MNCTKHYHYIKQTKHVYYIDIDMIIRMLEPWRCYFTMYDYCVPFMMTLLDSLEWVSLCGRLSSSSWPTAGCCWGRAVAVPLSGYSCAAHPKGRHYSFCLFICPIVSLICMASLTCLSNVHPPNTSVTSIVNVPGTTIPSTIPDFRQTQTPAESHTQTPRRREAYSRRRATPKFKKERAGGMAADPAATPRPVVMSQSFGVRYAWVGQSEPGTATTQLTYNNIRQSSRRGAETVQNQLNIVLKCHREEWNSSNTKHYEIIIIMISFLWIKKPFIFIVRRRPLWISPVSVTNVVLLCRRPSNWWTSTYTTRGGRLWSVPTWSWQQPRLSRCSHISDGLPRTVGWGRELTSRRKSS